MPAAAGGVRPGRLALVSLIGVSIWALPRPAEVDPRAWQLLALFVATVVGIVTKPLPMGAMALVGIGVALVTRTLTLGEALGGFANGVVWLVVAAFFLAAGFTRTGLGPRIAYALVALFGRSTLGLGYSLVATDLILAPVIPSNTARAAGVVFPILQSIARTALGSDPTHRRKTSAFLTLAAYQGTVVTSAMFLTAMVANPLAVQLAAAQGIEITWGAWAQAALVPGLVSLIVVPLVVYRFCPPGSAGTPEAPVLARAALAKMGPMTRAEGLMSVVSVSLLIAWILGPRIGLDSTSAALAAVAALLVAGILNWDDMIREQEAWNTFIWFATLVMMATALDELGFIRWFSERVGSVFAGIGWVPGFLGLSLTYFYSHYFFASNTAHVSAMYAPFLAVALALGTPPLMAALILGFFSNLFASLTHYGTAPAPILFGSGHVTLGTWWKVGAIVSVVNLTIWLGIGGAWWKVLGIW
ncbi:MAG: DASS family sodium-coupled anion symporter [Acidobacteria bacterium]|nr:DASS family sodium-coupled anion symporter [Acidobacteriota bacterium]